jgi:hypothetical protein
MSIIRYRLAVIVVALLSACAPITAEQTGDQPRVALVNAPAEQRVSILADLLTAEMSGVRGCCAFEFVRSSPLRFQETHRDMFGSRAAPQAASIARNLGAEFAVMAAAPVFERTVERFDDGSRDVRGSVRVRAVVLDPETAEQLAAVGSFTFRDARSLGADEPLPEPDEDPLMIVLTEQAAADLAPHLAAVLGDLASEWAQRK